MTVTRGPLLGQAWMLQIRPSAGMRFLTANHREHRHAEADMKRAWRKLAYQAAERADLPQGLARVRIDAVLTFRTHRKRDPSNYEATLKPIVDGLAGQAHNGAVAYGLVPDDDPRYVDGPHIEIGPVHPLGSRLPWPGVVDLLITKLEA